MSSRSNHRRQQGAALIVGMLLLLVLTLLAISGMNTASLELLMAGNVQYQQNAFQAAEAGLEDGYYLGKDFVEIEDEEIDSLAATYSVTRTPLDGGRVKGNTPGFSAGKTGMITFELTSSATSARGARAVNVLGYGVVSPNDQQDVGPIDAASPGLE